MRAKAKKHPSPTETAVCMRLARTQSSGPMRGATATSMGEISTIRTQACSPGEAFKYSGPDINLIA